MTDPNQPPAEGDPFAPPPSGDAVPPVAGQPTPPPPGIPGDVPPPPPPPAYGAPVPAPSYGAMPPAYGAPAAEVPNNMGLAIAALVVGLCCSGIFGLITGIIAVVQASSVKGKAAVGDVAGATEAARKARLFSLITFGIAVVGAIIGVILYATGFFATSTTTTGF
jgi:hypothetical protein